MKYFRITRTWSVKAEDEAEALRLIAADPTKHLESETVARTEYKKQKQETGWAAGICNQLTGSTVSVKRSRLPLPRLWGKQRELNSRERR